MKASEAFKKLKRAVNINHYIGMKAAKLIEEACADKPAKEPAKESTKPVSKKSK